jgi:hypothetical protein
MSVYPRSEVTLWNGVKLAASAESEPRIHAALCALGCADGPLVREFSFYPATQMPTVRQAANLAMATVGDLIA